MGIDGNEIDDLLAWHGSSLLLIGTEPAFDIPAEVAKGVIGAQMSRKYECLLSICGQRQAEGLLKRPSAKRVGELLNLGRNQLRTIMGLLRGQSFKTTLFKVGLVDSPGCDRCKQASDMDAHILYHCEALAALRFMHLGHHFFKPGDSIDVSISKVLHSEVQGARVTAVPSLLYSTVLCCA